MTEPKKIQPRVERILKNYPETRGSDKLLQIKYLNQYQNTNFSQEQIQALLKAPSLESIRRSRQKIQEAGKYLPSSDVILRRRKLEDKYRVEMKRPNYQFDPIRQVYIQT